jgi:hypothetical protein
MLEHWRHNISIVNAGTLGPRFANWFPKFDGILFSALGPIQGHKIQHFTSNLGQIENILFYFRLDS